MNHPGLAAALLTLLGPGWREISPVSGEDGPIGSLDDGRSDKTKARAVVRQLMGERLFSGWGVRTLAVGEGRYNPIGYHVGTIWPFDNSFVAWGLRRYGFKAEAARVAAGILEAAEFFKGRLPEAFGGYPRSMTKYPVQYPTACSPPAWSTGAPLLLLRTMLGLEPVGEHLPVDPALPSTIGHLELLDIPGRWGRVDAFARASGFRLLESPWMDEARSPCTGPRSSGQAALGTEERPWGDLPTSRVTTGLDRGELVSLLTLVVVLAPFMTDVTLVSKVATAAIGLVSGEGWMAHPGGHLRGLGRPAGMLAPAPVAGRPLVVLLAIRLSRWWRACEVAVPCVSEAVEP